MAKKVGPKPSPQKQKGNRNLVLRALTDRRFRKLLEQEPSRALGKPATEINQRELSLVLATVRGLEAQIKSVGDELLCLNGPCGIA